MCGLTSVSSPCFVSLLSCAVLMCACVDVSKVTGMDDFEGLVGFFAGCLIEQRRGGGGGGVNGEVV